MTTTDGPMPPLQADERGRRVGYTRHADDAGSDQGATPRQLAERGLSIDEHSLWRESANIGA
jgi:hypothetical protein